MPFVTPSQYIESADEFVAHWGQVNAALAPTPLILRGAYALANLQSDRADLQNFLTAVQNADNAQQTAAADRDIKRNALKERLRQYIATVRGLVGGAPNANSLPKMPSTNAAPGKWIDALDDIAGSWNTINTAPPTGFTAPLRLAGGYTFASFSSELAALKAAFTAVTNAERAAALARRQRDDLAAPMRTRLKEYRQAVAGAFPANNALISATPALSAAPGATPAPVNVSVTWNAATNKAVLTWAASTDPNLARYAVRAHPGARYKADDEQSVEANVPKTATSYATDYGLVAPGSVQYFKVYVITNTGNEKGSNAVKATRL